MNETDSLEVSYEPSHVVRDSMVPLIDDAYNQLKILFTEAKKKTTLANNVWKKAARGDDYKVDAVLEVNLDNLNDFNADSVKEMLHSYCDQTNAAKREAAFNAERCMNLQSRLSATESANIRLNKVLEEAESKVFDLLEKLNQKEGVRINLIREFKEINDKYSHENKSLKKDLNAATKNVHELEKEKRLQETQRRTMDNELQQLRDRANFAENEVSSLQGKLSAALQRESESNLVLKETKNSVEKLKYELEEEKKRSRYEIEETERDVKRSYKEREDELNRELRSYKNQLAQLHEEHTMRLAEHEKVAKEAIERLTQDVEELDASRMKYYKQYKELLENLNDHKRKISQDVLKQAVIKLTTEFSKDQVKTSQIRKGLQNIELQAVPNFGERILDVLESRSSSSDGVFLPNRNENRAPSATRTKPAHVRSSARSYDVRGQFGNQRRH